MLASERFGKALHSRDLANYRVARRGTIVADPMLLWDGSIGRQEVVDVGVVSPDYRVYEISGSVASDFMRYVVRDPRMFRHYQGGARGTNVRRNRIARSDFLQIPLKLPSLSEQHKIASILSSVDELIEKTQGVIEQVGAVKKSMIQEMLTRGLPGRQTRLKQTEIGEIPKEWEVVTLGDVTTASAFGPRFPATQYDANGRYGTLRTTDVTDDWEIDYNTVPRANLPPGRFDEHCLRDGDLVVTRSGTCGVVCVFREQSTPVIPGAFLIRFRLCARVAPEFVRLAMMAPEMAARVQRMAAGGVQKNLSGTNLRQLPLPLPSISEQQGIVQVIENVQARVRGERELLRQLHNVKSALTSALLTGELRVTADKESA